MVLLLNDLLVREGIAPSEVRLLRHRTDPGAGGQTLYDLWLQDREGFELYQKTQNPKKVLFRSGAVWAAFVSPEKGRTLFAGLYGARFVERRVVEWLCPYRGDAPGGGEPVDVFETYLRDELRDQIGRLEIEWPQESARTWARYAEGASFQLVTSTLKPRPRGSTTDSMSQAIEGAGFEEWHRTSKVVGYERAGLLIYLKIDTDRQPLVLHPRYFDIVDDLERISGVSFERPLRPYVNSNMRGLPIYEAPHRDTRSRYGFAVSAEPSSIPALVSVLYGHRSIDVAGEEVRLVGDESNPLTEKERLTAARVGQGEFRYALMGLWGGKCPVAGVDHPRLLRASHIKPWRSASGSERLDPYNGILLSAHVDALFDAGLISFENDGRMLVSDALGTINLDRMGIATETRIIGLTSRHAPYLAHHRSDVFIG